ncbi:V-set and transmembrane domain-containing protein 2-like protein [Ochotona princeps]|uniref:V-set and transmembrane domain-containing protein 2-like protein n=2 Tax=Ochotona TaxID=9977 RepID=UPI0027144B0D|nr:V-set and transmembrane domain-containing protein 2-like protein [Ochotona princeps]
MINQAADPSAAAAPGGRVRRHERRGLPPRGRVPQSAAQPAGCALAARCPLPAARSRGRAGSGRGPASAAAPGPRTRARRRRRPGSQAAPGARALRCAKPPCEAAAPPARALTMGAPLAGALGALHYLALFLQLGGATRAAGRAPWDNHVSGHALFTETPHDMTARTGEDVELACSFRGSGSPSYSLEIQWWYVRSHRDWTDKQAWASNQLKASQQEDTGKDATKISVVKVVGSNISHKLRLSRVKPTDEGTYECRVIDFSDGKARHHKVKAYLRVQPGENSVLHLPEAPPAAPAPPPPKPGKELRKRSVDQEACSL